MRGHHLNLKLAATVAAVLAGLGASAAQATTMPPATFVYTVVNGLTPACPTGPQATDGTCLSGPGYATTNGGTINNAGTSVLAGATGPIQSSIATMTYYFEVGGPASPTGHIAVDILSSGYATVTGGLGGAFAFMDVVDAGPDAAVATNSLNLAGPVVDHHNDAVGCASASICGTTGAAWTQLTQFDADHLCLKQGEVYAITISAGISALGKGATGSAFVDPKIIVDPEGPDDPPTSCFQPVDPSIYQASISISSGASTGVPEPGTLGLMGLGLFGIGIARHVSRRVRRPS